MKGKILSKTYSVYNVLSYDNNEMYSLSIRGSLKRNKNVSVGDNVIFDENNKTIEDIYERTNFLIRPAIANLDYLIIVSSLIEPTFSYDLVFKYLTYANARGIKTILVISKIDLQGNKIENEIKEIYTSYNIPVYFISSKTKEGIDELKEKIKGKTIAFMGQSGVGKSSLLNAIDSSFNRDEGQYSIALGRGKHQTKETILFSYNGGFLADTPGFSSLDLNLKKDEISKFFPRFEEFYVKCEFFDCLHIKERNCAIKKAIEHNIIHKKGYECYIKLINDVDVFRR